jgi:hypothetical protein
MDIYQSVVDYLLTFPIFESWHEMEAILRRSASGHPMIGNCPSSSARLEAFFREQSQHKRQEGSGANDIK